MPGIMIGNSTVNRRFSWSSYWTQLISATVEDTEPTKVVIVYGSGKKVLASDYNIEGKTISSLDLSADKKTHTLTLSTSVTYGEVLTVSLKGLTAKAITNNVLRAKVLLDQFITNDPTPIASPRTCEPIGAITAIQNDGTIAISGGKIEFTAQSTPDGKDLGLSLGAITRGAGKCVSFRFVSNDVATHLYYGMGFYNTDNPVSDAGREVVIYLKDTNKIGFYNGAYSIDIPTPLRRYNVIDYLIILLSKGAIALVKDKVDYLNWTIISVDNKSSTANLFAKILSFNKAGLLGNTQLFNLPTPLNDDNLLTKTHVVSPANGETLVGTANGVITLTWNVVTGEILNVMFRRVDDDNCWIARFVQAEGKMYLFQKQVGVETERGASGGVAVTLTNGTAVLIKVQASGQTIKIMYDITLSTTYASASFNQTSTGVKVSGAASMANLRVYPATVQSADETIINSYFVFPNLGKLIIYDGDSLTAGIGTTAGNSYPEQCNALLPLGAKDSWHNSGVAGQEINQMDGHAYSDVHPRYNTDYSSNVLVVWCGTNDLKASVAIATVQTRFNDYITHVKSFGYTKIIVLTALPRGDSEPVGFEANRQTWNTWLRGQASVQGFIIADVAADSRIGNDGSCDDTTYYDNDKVHTNNAGAGIVAGIVASAIESIT